MASQQITTTPTTLTYNIYVGQDLDTNIILTSTKGPTLQNTNYNAAGYVSAGTDGSADYIFLNVESANTINVRVGSSQSAGKYKCTISVSGGTVNGESYDDWTKNIIININELPSQSFYPILKYNQDTPYIYNGTEYSVYFESFLQSSEYVAIDGKTYYEKIYVIANSSINTSATEAGSYEAACRYIWQLLLKTTPDETVVASKENILYTKDWTILDPPPYPDHINPEFNYSGPFTYDGNEKTVSFKMETISNVITEYAGISITWELLSTIITDSDISGTLKAIAPGDYTATANYSWQVRPKTNYSGEVKSGRDTYNASWKINKAPGFITLSSTSIELTIGSSGYISIINSSATPKIGTISDDSISATISFKDAEITIIGTKQVSGSVEVIVDENDYYLGATKTISVSIIEKEENPFSVDKTEIEISKDNADYSKFGNIYLSNYTNINNISATSSDDSSYISYPLSNNAGTSEWWYNVRALKEVSSDKTITLSITDRGNDIYASKTIKITVILKAKYNQSIKFDKESIENALIGKTYAATITPKPVGAVTISKSGANKSGVDAEYADSNLKMYINGDLNQFEPTNPNVVIKLSFSGSSTYKPAEISIALKPLQESYVNLYKNGKWQTYLVRTFRKDESNNYVPYTCDTKVHKTVGGETKFVRLGVYDEQTNKEN